jgi:Cu-Zn family superoxide dismutase
MKKKSYFAVAVSALLTGACATSTPPAPSATAALNPASGSKVNGTVTFTQVGKDQVRVTGNLAGHSPGQKGFHIHEKGDCSAPDATSAGGHFNPLKTKHASSPTSGHAGDMGNLTFDGAGRATVNMVLDGLSVSSGAPNGIVGRAVVVHMQPDDLATDPTGNAGGRAACGVIR